MNALENSWQTSLEGEQMAHVTMSECPVQRIVESSTESVLLKRENGGRQTDYLNEDCRLGLRCETSKCVLTAKA